MYELIFGSLWAKRSAIFTRVSSIGVYFVALKFTKMHALGNDFIVIDATKNKFMLTVAQIKALSSRHKGIGFDQCLVIEKSDKKDIDFFYRIFNADGTEVGQCGNGARCIAKYIKHYQLSTKNQFTVATCTITMVLKLNSDDTVTIELPAPNFSEKLICSAHIVDVGNPHAVLLEEDIKNIAVSTIGASISTNKAFPQQTNVEFMQIIDNNNIKIRIYERGVGETRACGSGAIAAAAVAIKYYNVAHKLYVHMHDGSVIVEWQNSSNICITGDAVFVYEGILELF